jgi:uncharacterized Rossmann fold enzyme
MLWPGPLQKGSTAVSCYLQRLGAVLIVKVHGNNTFTLCNGQIVIWIVTIQIVMPLHIRLLW